MFPCTLCAGGSHSKIPCPPSSAPSSPSPDAGKSRSAGAQAWNPHAPHPHPHWNHGVYKPADPSARLSTSPAPRNPQYSHMPTAALSP